MHDHFLDRSAPAAFLGGASVTQSLREQTFYRLVDAGHDAVVDFVMAAFDGTGALDAVLAGGASPERPDPSSPRRTPAGTFLCGLTVQGFRGVGPRAELRLNPGPGLTVVAGRNGSGKSSLAEALECALTGTTARWDRKVGMDARTAWRNLHAPEPCVIEVQVTQPGHGLGTLRVAWAADTTDPATASRTYQAHGQRRQDVQDALGWDAALTSYSPLLSYNDLGRLTTAKPSELHDSISRALALDELHAAVDLLKARVAPLKQPLTRSTAARRVLRTELEDVDDERARRAARLLSKTTPDLDALLALVVGGQPDARQDVIARIREVTVPDEFEVAGAAADWDRAAAELREQAQQRDDHDRLRDRLLHDALLWHTDAGLAPCPVCGTGQLDDRWRTAVEEALRRTDLFQEARDQAERRLRTAEQDARELLHRRPSILDQDELDLAAQAEASERWEQWTTPEGPLGDHLRNRRSALAMAVKAWQAEAERQADELQARWAPYALRVAEWVKEHQDAIELARQAESTEAAYQAALRLEQELRSERLGPIVERAQHIWGQLRQESNVSLDAITLSGLGNRRTVDIRATVDGTDGDALAVMSQGELNSLALSLFIPRVTSEQSPFRFLVLDDPVQAMDPTKVEGLAAVLAEIAQSHQVVVFSHDDRLAQAVRRLAVPPTILQVTRSEHSEVRVSSALRPADRDLEEVRALVRDDGVDERVLRRVLPGLLRHAIEEVAWERYCRERLGQGDQLEALEAAWHADPRLRGRLTLLLGAGYDGWIRGDPRRRRAVTACNRGAHEPVAGDLGEVYADVRATVQAIESGAR